MNTLDIPVGQDSIVRLIVNVSIQELAGDNASRVGTLLLDSALWFPSEMAKEIRHYVFDIGPGSHDGNGPTNSLSVDPMGVFHLLDTTVPY